MRIAIIIEPAKPSPRQNVSCCSGVGFARSVAGRRVSSVMRRAGWLPLFEGKRDIQMRPSFASTVLCFVMAILASRCGPGGLEITDYQKGYNQGIEEVREWRAKAGPAEQLAMKAFSSLDIYPPHSDKSADWNAGYRQGIKDEMAK